MIIEYLGDGSPECPLIRIFSPFDTGFVEFRNMILALEEDDHVFLRINAMGIWEFRNVQEAIFSNQNNDGAVLNDGIFRWSMSKESWNIASSLIEPLIKFPPEQEAHQWLSGPNTDDPLPASGLSVVVSKSVSGAW